MEAKSPFRGLAFGAVASCLAEICKAAEEEAGEEETGAVEKRERVMW